MMETRQHAGMTRLVKNGLTAVVAAGTLAAVLGTWHVRAPRVEASTQAVAQGARAVAPQESYADLVARVAPAVVTIRSARTVRQAEFPMGDDLLRRFFGQEPGSRGMPHRQDGLGSGVVVSQDGYILTNNHVVEGADKIQVDLPGGQSYEARVVGTDQPSDLAVLKIPASGLAKIPMGNSDEARVGDVVLAIGNPLGLGQTVTMGIISAKGRATGASEGAFEDFIQTDAPINQGNSGGALINTRGELVGINSQILSPVGYNIGIGFAVPANMADSVMHQLIKTGRVRRGMLGVTVQAVNPALAKSLGIGQARGAIVTDVSADSPAARAGLKTGDLIVALEGQPVASSNDLRNHVARLGPGADVALTILRDGQEQQLHATLAELPGARTASRTPAGQPEDSRYGMAVEPLSPELARHIGIDDKTRGVVVSDLDPAGQAAEAGLQTGDIIEQVNRKSVTDAGQLRTALAKTDGPALLLVNRRGTRLFMALGPDRG